MDAAVIASLAVRAGDKGFQCGGQFDRTVSAPHFLSACQWHTYGKTHPGTGRAYHTKT